MHNSPQPSHHYQGILWSSLIRIKFLMRNLYLSEDKPLSSAYNLSLFPKKWTYNSFFLLLADNLIHGILEHFFCIYILAQVHHIVTWFTVFLSSLPTSFGENERKAETRYIKPQSFGCLIFAPFLLVSSSQSFHLVLLNKPFFFLVC